LGAGVVGVALTYVVVDNIEHARETREDRAKARLVAHAIAMDIAGGASRADLARVQAVLPNDQVIVTRRGRVAFVGPPLLSRAIEVRAREAFPDGRVTVIDHESATTGAPTAALASA